VEAVRWIGRGGSIVDPAVVGLLIDRRRRSGLRALSERERAILALMAEGRSNEAISERLHLSPKTVDTHIHNIFAKLGLARAASNNRRVLAVLEYLRS
jgi:DNA-binding NarL/FixJ family response regulator